MRSLAIRSSRPAAAAIILALALGGCTSTPQISTDYDNSTNFSTYRSYSWAYTSVPQGMNPLVYQRLRDSIDRTLGTRFQQSNPGDFAVAFTVGKRDRVEVNDLGAYRPYYRGWGWGPGYGNIDVRNVTDGTLVIDIYDTKSKRAVWHGVATQEVTSSNLDQARVDAVVGAVLAKFPPPPGTPPAQ